MSTVELTAQPAAADQTPLEVEEYTPQHASEREDIPPNGGYGWVCVACVLMINAHTWGINSVRNPPTFYHTLQNVLTDLNYSFRPLVCSLHTT